MSVEVAYILKGFPRLSETFISNEIYMLESMGLRLGVFSIKHPDENITQDIVAGIDAPIWYLPPVPSLSTTPFSQWLKQSLPLYHRSHLALLKRKPGAYVAALFTAIAMGFQYRKSSGAYRKVFLKEYLQAGYIAEQILSCASVRHIHSHFCHGATTVALFVSKLTGLPFSFTAHAKDIYQDDQNPGLLLRKKIRQARFVATCTRANHEHLQALAGANNIHKIYHGLDVAYFRPSLAGVAVDPARTRILSVGRFVEKKGFTYLVEACAILKRRGYAFSCEIIGEKGAHYDTVAQLIARLDVADRVTLRGPISQRALAPLYHQCDVFALPCQVLDDGDRDGIPNVLVEAMSSGAAVVSTAVSGIPELIEHLVDGILIPEKDSARLAAALVELINNPGLRRRLINHARRKICRDFDSSRTTQDLKRLFDASLDSASAPARL